MTSKVENEADKDEKDQEYPIVLQCLKCGNVLGDSCSWVCANKDLKTVTLRRVTNAVESEHKLVTSEKGIDIGSTYRQLYCVMCDEILGRIYQTTPKLLDNLRDVFTLDINKIQSYQVGSGEQTTGVDSDVLDPPSARSLQDDLYKIKTTICALNQRIVNLENALKSDEPDEEMEEEENKDKGKEEEEEEVDENEADDEGESKSDLSLSSNRNRSGVRQENIVTGNGHTLSDPGSHVGYDSRKTGNKQHIPKDSPHRLKRKRTK